MKTLKSISSLVLLAISIMFMSCTTDPIPGPPGADGLDGVDGVDGMDGINGTTECATCHTIAHKEEIEGKFAMSGHGSMDGAWARGRSASCAQCHGSLGYVDYINNGAVSEAEGAYANTGVMNCKTCHDTHTTFDFENEGYDYALRNFDPVKLVIDEATIIDFGGTSNNCITCHQPRNSYPVPGGTGEVTITSQRYGPHHGPQATMLQGIMAANLTGSTQYPAPGSATHRTGSSCVNCHMNEGTTEDNGSHTFNVSLNACTTCHENMTEIPDEINGFTADFKALEDLLLAKGYIGEDGYVKGPNGENASSSNPLVVSAQDASAIWNYKTVYEDQSHGIHNPAYTRALLKNSIEALQN
ncbi:multiheme c-type cytochrome [Namhaeicola litoreus]|uniref:Cytochrome c domain-containing protein n=1 Tax=Namhaeicola litoreus TaxID=1052145 RepID=A0ABW3XYS5_9FLAO